MKINGLSQGGTSAATARTGSARATPASTRPDASEEVRLSPASSQLAAGAAEAVVDSARVHEIRQAILEGRFKINSGAIADALIASARDLVDSQRKA